METQLDYSKMSIEQIRELAKKSTVSIKEMIEKTISVNDEQKTNFDGWNDEQKIGFFHLYHYMNRTFIAYGNKKIDEIYIIPLNQINCEKIGNMIKILPEKTISELVELVGLKNDEKTKYFNRTKHMIKYYQKDGLMYLDKILPSAVGKEYGVHLEIGEKIEKDENGKDVKKPEYILEIQRVPGTECPFSFVGHLPEQPNKEYRQPIRFFSIMSKIGAKDETKDGEKDGAKDEQKTDNLPEPEPEKTVEPEPTKDAKK